MSSNEKWEHDADHLRYWTRTEGMVPGCKHPVAVVGMYKKGLGPSREAEHTMYDESWSVGQVTKLKHRRITYAVRITGLCPTIL